MFYTLSRSLLPQAPKMYNNVDKIWFWWQSWNYKEWIISDWQESFIVSLYKGKGDALNRGNYRGLKLIEQEMKVLEHVVEGLIRQRVEIDEMQCGFMSGRGSTNAIFIVRQPQEKHLAANKPLYMAFVDLEKTFNQVPRDVIWWAMCKLGIDE